MMLAELQTVKDRLVLTDAVDDALLTNFIQAMGGRFEQFCNRRFERTVGATWEFDADRTEVIPDRLPIEAVTALELKTDEATGWVAQTDITYLLRRQAVVSLETPLGSIRELGRITFTGGYVLPGNVPGAGQTALPVEISGALVEQVAYLYQNRNRLGLVSVAAEGGSIQQFAQLDLLPSVKEVLRKHERFEA